MNKLCYYSFYDGLIVAGGTIAGLGAIAHDSDYLLMGGLVSLVSIIGRTQHNFYNELHEKITELAESEGITYDEARKKYLGPPYLRLL